MSKSAPLQLITMLIESIQNKPLSSQHNLPSTHTAPKQPSKGCCKADLQQAWAYFIKSFEPFQWYATLTFKDPKHPESADKAFLRWIRYINESLYGRRYREKKKGVTYIKCMEYQKRDVIHFHCLVGDPHLYKLKRMDFMKAWECGCQHSNELVNGYARIKKYNATKGAVNYCSKYVSKGGEIDPYISPEQLHLLNDKEPLLKFMN